MAYVLTPLIVLTCSLQQLYRAIREDNELDFPRSNFVFCSLPSIIFSDRLMKTAQHRN